MMEYFWDCWPGLLEHQLEELRRANINVVSEARDEVTGTVQLELEHLFEGNQLRLIVKFPAFFPYTRFEVFAPDLNLEHHQNPLTKNLCLIGRSTINWNVDDTVAQFITER